MRLMIWCLAEADTFQISVLLVSPFVDIGFATYVCGVANVITSHSNHNTSLRRSPNLEQLILER
jgi:hypothetical protein